MANSTVAGDKRIPGHSIVEWAKAILAGLGAPDSAGNEQALIAWANHESGGYNPSVAGGRNNPLNTTEGAKGYVGNGGSQGNIKDFGSFAQGVEAQVYNLLHTRGAGYESIVSAFRSNAGIGSINAAINASHFGTHNLPTGGAIAPVSTADLAGGGVASSGGGDGGQNATLAVSFNPLDWMGSLFGGSSGSIARVVLTMTFVGAGLTLGVLGLWRAVGPQIKSVTDDVAPIAMAAAL